MTEERLLHHRVGPTFHLLDFGRPLPNYRLLRSPCDCRWVHGTEIELGDWLLVRTDEVTRPGWPEDTIEPRHHIVARWKETPTYETMFGMSWDKSRDFFEELAATRKHERKWLPEDFFKRLEMKARDGYLLIQDAKERGYNDSIYNFDRWLLDHLGKWLSMAPQLDVNDISILPHDSAKVATGIGRFPIYYDMIETGDWDGEQFLYEPHVDYYEHEVRIDAPGILPG